MEVTLAPPSLEATLLLQQHAGLFSCTPQPGSVPVGSASLTLITVPAFIYYITMSAEVTALGGSTQK